MDTKLSPGCHDYRCTARRHDDVQWAGHIPELQLSINKPIKLNIFNTMSKVDDIERNLSSFHASNNKL
jgi:hypothetical protein